MDHLTPDVLAAWMDGALTASERAAAEAHASDCAHCQAMLAAMARITPAPAQRAWWSMPAIRWLVPIAAALVVIAVWIGGERTDEREAKQVALRPGAEQTEAPSVGVKAAPPATETRSAADNAAARNATLQAKADPRVSKDEARSKGAVGGVAGGIDSFADKKRIDAISPLGARAEAARAAAAAADTSQPVAEPQSLVATAPPSLPEAGAPVPSAPPPPAQTPPPTAPLPVQERVTVTSESALNKSSARGAAGARLRTVDVVSPERAFRWRALEPGSVQYSMDGGTNWRRSSTGTSVALHAGAAPSRNVCWLVGQAGTVLLTIDGQTWQVRPFPERVDLTDVRATDARNATVTTANSRRFATSDGGATWSPLQEN